MHALPLSLTATPLHIISIDAEPEDAEQALSAAEQGQLQDIGLGLAWGIEAATAAALAQKKPCLVWAPVLKQVLYCVRPADITIH